MATVYNPCRFCRLQKNQKAHLVRVVVTCNDHRLIWQDSFKVVEEHALTPDESILYQTMMNIITR